MSETFLFQFSITDTIHTNDDYNINLKGNVKSTISKIDESKLDQFMISIIKPYFKGKTLFEVLSLVETGNYKDLQNVIINESVKHEMGLSDFQILTIDAVQSSEQIIIEIDPNLEKKGKTKGIFGRLFGKK